MEHLLRREVAGRLAVAAVTECDDGDIRPDRVDAAVLRDRQIGLTGSSWVMLDEVHGTDIVTVNGAERWAWPIAGSGDVLVADRSDAQLAVWVADCAPIALFGANGTTRVVIHAGWRGLARGVIDVGVDALESTGTNVAIAVLGPCIHACCYEFGAGDLQQVAAGVRGPVSDLTGATAWGTPALDVPAAVTIALERRGITLDVAGVCTGCEQRFRSHRRRGESERHAVIAWFEEAS
jgi:copper oxidase (laccase) domain-containing protein